MHKKYQLKERPWRKPLIYSLLIENTLLKYVLAPESQCANGVFS